jgi:single-strand DNA-binding protein
MYNRVIMIGNLTRDIELRFLSSGGAIAKSAIATSNRYKTASGEQREEVCFLDFQVFGKSAEILNQYVKKGSKVLLEGKLVFEQWKAQDGTNRSKHSLTVENFKFLDSRSDQMNGGNANMQQNNNSFSQQQNSIQQPNNMQQSFHQQQVAPAPQTEKLPEINVDEDDVPF